MKMIAKSDCEEWLTNQGTKVADWDKQFPYSAAYALPTDTGKKTALARTLIELVDANMPGLFWITEWGVFPTSQYIALFDGYRKSLGESRSIDEAPGHIFFGSSDSEALCCLLCVALYFYWDSILLEGSGNLTIRISHDEYISIHTADLNRMNELQRTLERLNLRQIG